MIGEHFDSDVHTICVKADSRTKVTVQTASYWGIYNTLCQHYHHNKKKKPALGEKPGENNSCSLLKL